MTPKPNNTKSENDLGDMIDLLNVLCEDFGCEPGSDRLHWLHNELSALQSLRRSGGVAVSGLTVSTAIKDALRELDNVTAISDEDANCLGCAENLLRQALDALSALSPAPEGEPVAWQHRGPRGGWITTDEETDYSERALYASPPKAVTITDEWLRDTAMNVMLATEVEEAIRILTAALSSEAHNGQ